MSGQSAEVYRIDWVPGSDLLHGVCHCGAEHRAADPVAMWEWMLGHPLGHEVGAEEGSTEESSTDEGSINEGSTNENSADEGSTDERHP